MTQSIESQDAQQNRSGRLPFSVDSALLRELGERLVGKPHIALAELVKNSYDADAFHVDILFEDDYIEIVDNGHGMSFTDFESFWMRVGSSHKQDLRFSETLERNLTGSKGIGRLAVQFLAREIEITTRRRGTDQEVHARVDWDEAVQAGDLTQAEAVWHLHAPSERHFARGRPHGTSIRLTRLRQETWEKEDFRSLAKEIWWLQSPFLDPQRDESEDFSVELTTPYPDVLETFEEQMNAYLDLWYAKIDGKLTTNEDLLGKAHIALQFSDGTNYTYEHNIENCLVEHLRFEIRTYYLTGRLKYGIKVKEAREYFGENGGVYVYDSGFRLPYYGGKEHDWLGLEFDHAHRLSISRLLPKDLQVANGMEYLPTNSRILGSVQVDTSHERSAARKNALGTIPGDRSFVVSGIDHLEIQVTRDRLVDNKAYEQLRQAVRSAIDFYAVKETIRVYQEKEKARPLESPTRKFERVDEVLTRFAEEIPKPVFMQLQTEVQDAVAASESEAEAQAGQIALLSHLATAGMAALAHEHEAAKQLSLLKILIRRLDRHAMKTSASGADLTEILQGLKDWIEKARQTRRLFSHLLEDENRELETRLRAKSVLRDIVEQSAILLRGVHVDIVNFPEEFQLPYGTFADWTALFQNILINAGNAMLDVKDRKIQIIPEIKGSHYRIRVEDTGVGIDLNKSKQLFEPFARDLEISSERKQLGLGGTGLGLTIVRMIAESRGCRVDFTIPSPGFSTAFRLSWKEN